MARSAIQLRVVSRLSGDELYNTLVEVLEHLQELPSLPV